MEKKLKLNYKRTLIIGFAFFSILMVWQAYNFYCPLYLKTLLYSFLKEHDILEYQEFIIGLIMAMDNVLALFMLPFFGKLSDKTNTKYGKRMPYIIIGMLLTMLIFPLIAICYILNSITGLIISMVLVLILMNVYRSPAVALMPDVTPKPLRSTANGLINLVGYMGPILITIVNMIPFLTFTQGEKGLVSVFVPVIVVLISLLIAIMVLLIKIKEPKILNEMKEDMALGEELSTTNEKIEEDKPLGKKDKRNILILLLSVCLWYMSFNAVETFNSTYFDTYYSEYEIVDVVNFNNDNTYYILDDNDTYVVIEEDKYNIGDVLYEKTFKGSSIASQATIILTVSSVLTFAIAGYLTSKFGRKNCTGIGLVFMSGGFLVISFMNSINPFIYISFLFVGIGWALINVNSYPMMVEMSSSKNIGKFTGYYYTSSMLAQSLTPILLGSIIAFVPSVTLKHLFHYTAIMGVIALAVFILFKENKHANKEIKTGLSAFDQD